MATPNSVMTGWSLALPTLDPLGVGLRPIRDSAQAAEELGFDKVWLGDHLFFRGPILESLTAAAFTLGATRRLGVATGVLLPALREPVVLAKQLSSLAYIADGRFSLGIGVGGEFEPEWDAVGISVRERASRTDEFLQIWESWSAAGALEHRGRHWQISAPALEPRPSDRAIPDLWVGGRSTAALRRAVRLKGGWLGMLASPDRVRDAIHELHTLTPTGQERPSVGMIVFVHVGDADTARREMAEYTQSNFGTPFEKLERWVLTGSEESIAAGLRAYAEAGVSHFVLHAAAADQLAQFAKIRDVIVGAGLHG